jgi:para-aminobenzoate synthetase component I
MKDVFNKINKLGANRTPFLFIIDFEMETPLVFPINDISTSDIKYWINGVTNVGVIAGKIEKQITFNKFPPYYPQYIDSFNKVIRNIELGNSYLVNLTFMSQINTNLSLLEIFQYSKAKYKLLFQDKFVVFSPEIFIKIYDNRIFSFPMKGTIDAAIENAVSIIINDKKELAEHYTIVDLIRNDLNMVAKKVRVDRFRYIDEIKTIRKNLLQVSSQISGELTPDWHNRIGEILFTLLPAGSISGAPKKKTVEIIKDAETYSRGYYTGVMGIYDGNTLDSGVMIRFIENIEGITYFKSGGGITYLSNPISEYQELADKIYVPII